jgi:hypothetical protein
MKNFKTDMVSMINKLLLIMVVFLVIGCGANNNVTFSTNNGNCANGESGNPYCMGVIIQNNSGSSGGQNWINSTNFPISQITFSVSGVSNVISPATNPAGSSNSMDPNNCAGSTIGPGGSCQFYLQLTGEAFSVLSSESVNINLTYTVNDTLFGGSNNTSTANVTIYELTNLYIAQASGYMNLFNSAWNNYGLVESADTINSIAVDNSTYGNVYIGGSRGLYPWGVTYYSSAYGSISPSGYSGTNNLFSIGNTLYAALLSGSSAYSVNSYSFSGESFGSPLYSGATLQNLVANANAYISNISATYLTNGTAIYACSNGTTSGCFNEGISGISGTITSLAYSGSPTASTTGLYAGTNLSSGGLFYESGTITPSTSATWGMVTGESNAVTAMISTTESGVGVVFVGDSAGNVSVITSASPTVATPVGNVFSSVSALTYDQFEGVVYVANTSNNLYLCDGSGCNPMYNILGGSTVKAMAIGSMLVNSTNQLYNTGSL